MTPHELPTSHVCIAASVALSSMNSSFIATGAMQPIVDRSYCLPHEQVFFLEESVMSLSGDDFTIRDGSNPSHYYKLASSAFSMKGSRVLKDSGGRTILNMKHKVLPATLLLCVHHARRSTLPCIVLSQRHYAASNAIDDYVGLHAAKHKVCSKACAVQAHKVVCQMH